MKLWGETLKVSGLRDMFSIHLSLRGCLIVSLMIKEIVDGEPGTQCLSLRKLMQVVDVEKGETHYYSRKF